MAQKVAVFASQAAIMHDKRTRHLGCFDDDREAARAVDTAARRLRGDAAHGGQSGYNWNRLNFPTEAEVERAAEKGMTQTREDRAGKKPRLFAPF
jgi:hypothetical protein